MKREAFSEDMIAYYLYMLDIKLFVYRLAIEQSTKVINLKINETIAWKR